MCVCAPIRMWLYIDFCAPCLCRGMCVSSTLSHTRMHSFSPSLVQSAVFAARVYVCMCVCVTDETGCRRSVFSASSFLFPFILQCLSIRHIQARARHCITC